jgi:hypothetical protein
MKQFEPTRGTGVLSMTIATACQLASFAKKDWGSTRWLCDIEILRPSAEDSETQELEDILVIIAHLYCWNVKRVLSFFVVYFFMFG